MQRALVPEDLDRSARPKAAKYIARAAFARARHALGPHGGPSAEAIARSLWPVDDTTGLVLRAATAPATTTTTGWASQLAVSAVGDFVSSLAPMSAGAKLLDAATRVSLAGINSISFPARSGPIDPDAVPWVAEGAPIPVGQFALTAATLGPMHKLAILTAMTRETMEHGAGETVLTTLLRESASMALDASLFSDAAATADRPAGLLNGVAALPAAAAGDTAMDSDLSALATAISAYSTQLALIAHPAQAAAVRLRRGSMFPTDIPIWSTIAIPAGTVIALDPSALVSAFGAEPEITASDQAVLHMESETPLAIGTPPSTVASPARSLFQTDCIGVRLILRCAWAWRASGAVAWVEDANW